MNPMTSTNLKCKTRMTPNPATALRHRALVILLLAATAQMATAVDAWATVFVPSGLSAGDTYQLAFVTRDIRDATSANINDYNQFVTNQAALNPALTGTSMGVSWRAVAATSTVDANANALVVAPVYLLDSTKIADDYADFWDASLDSALDTDQFASLRPNNVVWTGTTTWGASGGAATLGGPGFAGTVGDNWSASSTWVVAGLRLLTDSYPLYALSSELTVPVPEPASVALLAMGAFGLCGALRRRRLS